MHNFPVKTRIPAMFLVALGLAGGVSRIAEAAGPPLASHRAFYELELKPRKDSAILASRGRLAYEVLGSSCEGWTVNYRLMNQFTPAEGPEHVMDSRSTSFEDGTGLAFKFAEKQFIDHKLDTDRKLSADRPALDKPGQGLETFPKEVKFALPPETLFPMQHQKHLIEMALAGNSRDSSRVYDGADDNKIYRVISFIGTRKTVKPETTVHDGGQLASLAAWPVNISYFSDKTKTDTDDMGKPDYQVSFDLFENGVAQNLVLDYGTFALQGRLVDYVAVKEAACK